MRDTKTLSALVLSMAAACGTAEMVSPNNNQASSGKGSVVSGTTGNTSSVGNGGDYSSSSSGGIGGAGGNYASGNGGGEIGGNNQGGFAGSTAANSGNGSTGGAMNQGGINQGGFSGAAGVGGSNAGGSDGGYGGYNATTGGNGGAGGSCGDLLGKFTTYTQGGWDNHAGSLPASLFVNGVLIGMQNADYAKFTTVKAATAFLPTMGMPAALQGKYVDPLTTSAGVLAGQTLTLQLNVLTSNQACGYTLGDLLVAEGACKGKSVNEVLDLADQALAGANVGLSYSDVNKCVEKINLNFDDGKVNNNYLTLP